MKNLILLSGLILLLLASCTEEQCTQEIPVFEPIYKTLDELREEIFITDPKPIENTGKFYLYQDYIFINELGKGFHIIDNSDPTNPQNVSFINLPGSRDIAIKNNVLYADNYADLVALDIKDLSDIQEIRRVTEVFDWDGQNYFYYDEELGYYIGRKFTGEYEEVPCYQNRSGLWSSGVDQSIPFTNSNIESSSPSQQGQAGSMARFALVGETLYALNRSDLNFINISTPNQMSLEGNSRIEWGVETLFPYGQHLFVGADDGMHIYDISEPHSPEHLSSYSHANACDPVVVDDDYAFVTLRSGTECEGFSNQLDVINIRDKTNPKLIKTYPMHNPHGLGLGQNKTLFICDGDEGLKVFNRDNIHNIDQNMIQQYDNIHAFDVIPLKESLLLIGKDGLYQYNYEDLNNIYEISSISIQ